MNNLDSIAEQIRKSLAAKDRAREQMLPLCRDSIRHSSNTIRAVHRQEFDEAEELLRKARSLISDAEKAVSSNRELANGGIIRDAHKEYAEASITLALVNGKSLPSPKTLRVDDAAYLNGLGEAVGEIRRYLLDSMRRGDLSRGEELLGIMDDIYSTLVTMDYPDAITGGLRRTTDMVRGVLERTRSDLTLTMRQEELEKRLVSLPVDIPASIEEAMSEKDMPETKTNEPVLDDKQMDIYEALIEWRQKRATEENLTENIIARNSMLKEIIRINPSNMHELMEIKGFGERRANKYGRDIMRILKKQP
ncbi:MAG TPA: haloacid dehalogenase [Dehalococcoidia bacterium]|nr:haloacid dehalogenase [Dehalococcoidia bacterium]